MNLPRLVAMVLVAWATVPADVIMKGYHSMSRKVCFALDSSAPAVVWANTKVSGSERHEYRRLASGDCPDQGYKFNSVRLYRVDPALLAGGFPADEIQPDTLAGWTRIRPLLEGQEVASNFTSVPDSLADNYQEWTYRVRGNSFAPWILKQGIKNSQGELIWTLTETRTIVWSEPTSAHVGRGKAALEISWSNPGTLRIRTQPGRGAQVRVLRANGEWIRTIPVQASAGEPIFLKLAAPLERGAMVELRQGSERAFVTVPAF